MKKEYIDPVFGVLEGGAVCLSFYNNSEYRRILRMVLELLAIFALDF
jgi:hypothetical protein